MKRTLLLFLALGICAAGCVAAPDSKVLLAQADTAKIAQVKAGTLKTANASWWGFDANDATECLQNAISSGVSTLIVDKMGSDWIVNKPIQLVSNQEIIFQDGVVVQAKKGEFKGRNDSLLMGQKVSNLKLTGQGNATLRMQRADYANPKLYTHAEWRHGIGLWDSKDIVIRGLTVEETGGDGLYLGASSSGYNKNVLVEDCNFDRNYRQGISVISAEDLTIRRCRLTNTRGTAPQAGIDYEPNHSGQRLVNCLLEDTVITGNAGGGVDVYAVNLTDQSPPISITVRRCTIGNNSVGVASTITRSAQNAAVAHITFEDCTFDHDRLNLRNAFVGSANYVFKNCTLDFSAVAEQKTAAWQNVPIVITTDGGLESQEVGGIKFDNVVIKTDRATPPVQVRFQGQGNLSVDVTGSIVLQNDGKTTPFNLQKFVADERARLAAINTLKPATLKADKLRPPVTSAPRDGNNTFYSRNKFTFLQYAQAGETITLNVTARKVIANETEVELQDPDGKTLRTVIIPYDNKPHPITFTAEKTGMYRLVRTQRFSQRIDITSDRPGNGMLIENGMDFLPIKGKAYFEVPAGVKKFTIGVSTDSSADVALLNAEGKEVERHNDVGGLQLFTATRSDASRAEIWALDVTNAVWSVVLHFYGDLQPIISTDPAALLRSDN